MWVKGLLLWSKRVEGIVRTVFYAKTFLFMELYSLVINETDNIIPHFYHDDHTDHSTAIESGLNKSQNQLRITKAPSTT